MRMDAQITPWKCDLNEGLKKFWHLDTLWIREDESSLYEEPEGSVISHNRRYEVRLVKTRDICTYQQEVIMMVIGRLQVG